ncbi:MAG: HlyD family type I secretion periplasmic adaptor subunit [Desulfuromonas sp.]|nr:MAG: HlyD family type I secretion periplasmic adaptor subunit [Desulfuromonas sp.]
MIRKENDSHEFKPLLVEIEERPLNPLGRVIYWLIIAAILFLGLWSFFGKVDVVVTARGKIVPVGEIKTMQPLNTGVVHEIFVSPGDHVSKGQVLMEIDPSEIDPELESMEIDLKQVDLEISRLESLLAKEEFNPDHRDSEPGLARMQNELFLSERKKLEKQVLVIKENLVQLDEKLSSEWQVYDQTEYLYGVCEDRLLRLGKVRDIISRDEYEQAEKDCRDYESQLFTSWHRIEELQANISQVRGELELTTSGERNRLLTELSEAQTRHLNLSAKIKRADFVSSRQQIRSPVNGYVAQLFIHTLGGVVTPAEKLATIVPEESGLVVKALLQNKDIGFVSTDMNASIKIDAFNFQKYGVLDGTVQHVSKDSIEDKNLGLVYEVYIDLVDNHLMVDGRNVPVSTGMSATAEIKVGKRRIIEFFIYPLIKYMDEGISVR